MNNAPFRTVVERGRPFELKLDFDGVPLPSFQWFKNGYKLEGVTGHVLYFAAISQEDEGTYSCELSNIAGSVIWLEGLIEVV